MVKVKVKYNPYQLSIDSGLRDVVVVVSRSFSEYIILAPLWCDKRWTLYIHTYMKGWGSSRMKGPLDGSSFLFVSLSVSIRDVYVVVRSQNPLELRSSRWDLSIDS